MQIVLTGGAGFVGSGVSFSTSTKDCEMHTIAELTRNGTEASLKAVINEPEYNRFLKMEFVSTSPQRNQEPQRSEHSQYVHGSRIRTPVLSEQGVGNGSEPSRFSLVRSARTTCLPTSFPREPTR
jgi:hypothetical protein